MKKNSMLLAAAMTFSTVAAMANPFSDVPASHWAFDAVNKLTSNGILQGYPDGTFKGEKNVTRYHLAMVVAKMLSNVEQMMGNGTGTNFVTKADLQTLEKLTVEFADELALLGVKVTALEDDMQVVKEDVAGVKKDVEAIKSHMANGGMEKVAISGDMHVFHGDQVKGQVGPGGQWTDAEFRLKFDAKIDENISATVRTVLHADTYGNQLGGAAANWGSVYGSRQNDVDLAFIDMKNMLFKGDLRIGRDYMSHGSALVLNDYVDAIQFSKKAGAVDLGINMIYGGDWFGRSDKDLWNINFGYEVKGHKLNLDYYTADYNAAVDADEKGQIIEFNANGELGNNGNFSYELAYISADVERVNADDLKGKLYHVAFKYDTKEAFAAKLAYTSGDDEYIGFLNCDTKVGYHYSYDDEVVSPLEDLRFMGYGNMCDANNFKVELFYKPVNSKHSVRLAYDMYEQDEDGTGVAGMKDEANILTLDYRYQLAENTRVRVGYATLDGDKLSDGIDDDRFFIELYSKF